MPVLQAQIETERASRYLVQFCKHAAAMGNSGPHSQRMQLHGKVTRSDVRVAAEWSSADGTVTFAPWGDCRLTANGKALTIRIEATDEDGLTRIRDILTRDLQRFSNREPLTVTWQPPD
jgi:hypothetical protein